MMNGEFLLQASVTPIKLSLRRTLVLPVILLSNLVAVSNFNFSNFSSQTFAQNKMLFAINSKLLKK